MSTISRPTKTSGNTSYVDEVADGSIHIKAVEVDADLDTIYTDYNGNITDANIASGANIATSKIAQDAGLQTGHYADNSITSAKILDGTIVAADLAPDSVTTSKILDSSVTLAKLAAGAGLRYANQQSDISIVVSTIDTTILTHPTRTPEGAASLTTIIVSCQGFISLQAVNTLVQVTLRLKKDATIVEASTIRAFLPTAGTTMVNMEVPFALTIVHLDALTTTATDWTVSLLKTTTGTDIVTVTDISSLLLEHA